MTAVTSTATGPTFEQAFLSLPASITADGSPGRADVQNGRRSE
jgi:hypothetical protein